MPKDTVSILDGNEFVVSDARGDIDDSATETLGLFRDDTRFLSRWILTINGQRPKLLSTDDLAYYRVGFFLAVATGTIYLDSHLSVQRQRWVGDGLHEELTLVNHDKEPAELTVRLEAAADFADLFEVKDRNPNKKGQVYRRVEDGVLTLGYRRDTFQRETTITSSSQAEVSEEGLLYRITIPPQGSWSTYVDVGAISNIRWRSDGGAGKSKNWHGAAEARPKGDASIQEWISAAPKLVSVRTPLERTYQRSLVDLAALRFQSVIFPGALPAAGLPWFMAIFGRDSLITSFQALPFVARARVDHAAHAGPAPGAGRRPVPRRGAGQDPHELRLGELTAFEERPHSPYYGAADSDHAVPDPARRVRALDRRPRADRARWSGKRAPPSTGSTTTATATVTATSSTSDATGRPASTTSAGRTRGIRSPSPTARWRPRRAPPASCRATSTTPSIRTARLARLVWGDPAWADQPRARGRGAQAALQRGLLDPRARVFRPGARWPEAQSRLADLQHRPPAVERDRRSGQGQSCVRHLMSDALFSGWGVRTMAVGEGSFNPIGYHVGTVWPHDTSIVSVGLAALRLPEGGGPARRGDSGGGRTFP